MYRINKKHAATGYLIHAAVSAPVFGKGDTVPIDQTPAKDFNIDPATGRPMSDITAIIRCQNAVEMQAMFSALPEYKSNFLPADMTDADALVYHTPRLAQLPSELAEVRANLTKYQLEQQEKAQLEKERENLLKEMDSPIEEHRNLHGS